MSSNKISSISSAIVMVESSEEKTFFNLKVKAGAKNNQIYGWIDSGSDSYSLKISIKAVAEDGKANIAIIKFLSYVWRIPQRNIEIISGHTNSSKKIKISGYIFKKSE